MEYVSIFNFTYLKRGFFGGVKGQYEYLMFSVKLKSGVMIFQIFQHFDKNFYLVGIVGGRESAIDEVKEDTINDLRYDPAVKLLEDKIPCSTKHTNGGGTFEINLKIVSKYVGKKLQLHVDGRLERGYYILEADINTKYRPSTLMKMPADYNKVDGEVKKARAFVSSKVKKITGEFGKNL
jgi:hypothetical protein